MFYSKKYEQLYFLYLYYNTYSISNGSVERKFSLIKHITDWKKNRLSDLHTKIKIMMIEKAEVELNYNKLN